jgi:hypothetical protein
VPFLVFRIRYVSLLMNPSPVADYDFLWECISSNFDLAENEANLRNPANQPYLAFKANSFLAGNAYSFRVSARRKVHSFLQLHNPQSHKTTKPARTPASNNASLSKAGPSPTFFIFLTHRTTPSDRLAKPVNPSRSTGRHQVSTTNAVQRYVQ